MAKNNATKTNEADAAQNSGVELVRKITNKVLYGEKPKAPEKEMSLATVFGIARGVKSGESNNGPWMALTGSFEAHTYDGRRLQSPVCFLPDPLNSALAEQLASDDVESVQFATEVLIVPSDVPIGYEYRTKMQVEPSGADPLADLRNRALNLPAPE